MAASRKQAQTYARQLLTLSLADGAVSAERVGGVLAYLEKHPPAHALTVLKAYHRLVSLELAKSHARVEHAGEIEGASLSAIEGAMAQKYGRSVTSTAQRNDSLLAGIRVRIADDVYDTSVAGKLAALAATV